ncbi:ABC transporter ATP-binding protein [Pedobacter sp. UBA5917]|jgi:lipopolysaccharide transport system ATP-binding protein|uniref:ABC transporter ATP-binding protein n=1 Tax=Pedobacter sp. UBA5917 TaxID=1947061 RepID=UPI0025F94505|nr:ABC transporter ATP-binding protein [Pedobacter sp. UBA5917]
MSKIAIKAENLSKAYQLGQIGTGTISRDLERWYARLRGKEDPFLRIGESNDQYSKSESNVVWSLRDISFEIEQGDAVGIIGRNGAGKSTLLKILSKVTAPTTGKISGKGRIASLLEVGTGFHPELSGRENIFLNGAILGMRKKEIQRKLEEIVDFAGIERYLDTPVKRYSSGMYVRLAFAVAAHLESEILIVDEVLAVGDAEFQKKCLGKMGEVSKGEGRTVLFVSHNMASVEQLCKKGIYLSNGKIKNADNINVIIDDYLNCENANTSSYESKVDKKDGNFLKIDLFEESGKKGNVFFNDTKPYLLIKYQLNEDVNNFNVGIIVSNSLNANIYSSADTDLNPSLTSLKKSGTYYVRVPLSVLNLNNGNYKITLLMGIINTTLFDEVSLDFTIQNNNYLNTGHRGGILLNIVKWDYLPK